jgi:membrane-associated phospholipid phosphatase
LYFALYGPESFKKLQTYIFTTQMVAMAVYILFPSRQDLRPEVFPRENVLTACTAFLYRIDTSTGVCPSLHVADSIALASVWLREKHVSPVFKAFLTVFLVLVCLSTMFLKQHSAVDFFAAIPVCLIAEAVIFGFSTSK